MSAINATSRPGTSAGSAADRRSRFCSQAEPCAEPESSDLEWLHEPATLRLLLVPPVEALAADQFHSSANLVPDDWADGSRALASTDRAAMCAAGPTILPALSRHLGRQTADLRTAWLTALSV